MISLDLCVWWPLDEGELDSCSACDIGKKRMPSRDSTESLLGELGQSSSRLAMLDVDAFVDVEPASHVSVGTSLEGS